MKKLVLMLLLFTMISCEPTCNNQTCGVIANEGIDLTSTPPCYWLEIRNECTDNLKKFCFDQDIWMDGYIGTYFCVNGVDPW